MRHAFRSILLALIAAFATAAGITLLTHEPSAGALVPARRQLDVHEGYLDSSRAPLSSPSDADPPSPRPVRRAMHRPHAARLPQLPSPLNADRPQVPEVSPTPNSGVTAALWPSAGARQ